MDEAGSAIEKSGGEGGKRNVTKKGKKGLLATGGGGKSTVKPKTRTGDHISGDVGRNRTFVTDNTKEVQKGLRCKRDDVDATKHGLSKQKRKQLRDWSAAPKWRGDRDKGQKGIQSGKRKKAAKTL